MQPSLCSSTQQTNFSKYLANSQILSSSIGQVFEYYIKLTSAQLGSNYAAKSNQSLLCNLENNMATKYLSILLHNVMTLWK